MSRKQFSFVGSLLLVGALALATPDSAQAQHRGGAFNSRAVGGFHGGGFNGVYRHQYLHTGYWGHQHYYPHHGYWGYQRYPYFRYGSYPYYYPSNGWYGSSVLLRFGV